MVKQVRLCCASAGMFRYEADTTVLGAYQGAVFRLYMKETEKSGWNRGNTAPGAGRSGAGGFFTLQERASCIVPPPAEEKLLRMQPAAGGESGRAGYYFKETPDNRRECLWRTIILRKRGT